MAINVPLNLAKMTVTSVDGSGQGVVTLNAAVPKYLTFANAGAVDGGLYLVLFREGDYFELSECTYDTTGPTLTRNTVIVASDGGGVDTTKIVLTSAATAEVVMGAAEYAAFLRLSGNQTLTGGFLNTIYTISASVTGSNQTITPSIVNGHYQKATLNGSSLTGTLTFAVPSAGDGSLVVQILNGGTGAVGATLSTSGYSKVTGDTYATTNGNEYNFYITRINSFYHLHIQALQ